MDALEAWLDGTDSVPKPGENHNDYVQHLYKVLKKTISLVRVYRKANSFYAGENDPGPSRRCGNGERARAAEDEATQIIA